MIVGYDAVKFDSTGQNEKASLVMVQVNDIGKGLERITVWPKSARRAGYTPVFPMPQVNMLTIEGQRWLPRQAGMKSPDPCLQPSFSALQGGNNAIYHRGHDQRCPYGIDLRSDGNGTDDHFRCSQGHQLCPRIDADGRYVRNVLGNNLDRDSSLPGPV